MATWGNSKEIFNQALGLQSTLANFVREERLLKQVTTNDSSWHQWAYAEAFKRTLGCIFCFSTFHTIVYNSPPLILNSELNVHLPCREADWESPTESDWQNARRFAIPEPKFQDCLGLLFSKDPSEDSTAYSSLGGYILILALIQHIYFLREMNKFKRDSSGSLLPSDVADVERALQNWQNGWDVNPETNLNPRSSQGPVSFNSAALLRMAYIRLSMDIGPCRTLETQNPLLIARAMQQSPRVKLGPRLTRAVLYSAHALSIPVKIGVNIVSRNQAFIWSLQQSLCALECAFALSKWLVTVHTRLPGEPFNEDEERLIAYIVDMVSEADSEFRLMSGGESSLNYVELAVRVVRIWARLYSGEVIWDVVRLMGQALEAYAKILEESFA
ncbi:uncharacterized protein N7458_004866 [Penicillium daleae]|uniref:Xylanolytic transcriptional activator regulatory domain-containing protein n=1 Tax=Penicillium daleae TaxID=63821 RepID=A0AAD6G490_9EURO|nr:uncharacterized protein N7458_004866 [Penicillium daleae]KAJ5453910.1 hypothetical protein N7458_004866 [Penicillium daleae]